MQNSNLSNNNNNNNSGTNIINEIVAMDLENRYHDFDKENDKNYENCSVTNNNVGETTNFEDDDLPKLLYEISTNDSECLNFQSTSFTEIWTKITDLVQKARVQYGLKSSLSKNEQNQLSNCFDVLGLKSNQVRFLLEQLSGANKSKKYRRQFDAFFRNIDNNKFINNNNNSSSLASSILPDDQSDVYDHEDDDPDVCYDTDNSKTTSRCNYFLFKRKSTDIFSWLTSKHRVAQFSSTITRK